MKISVLVILVVCFCAIGCQKELSSDTTTLGSGGTGGTGTTGDSIYLSRIVEIDSTSKDSSVLTFNYDNLKRVTAILDYEQGYGTDTSDIYYYTGGNNLPYKSVHSYYHQESFHFYSIQNKLIKDSVIADTRDTGHISLNTRTYFVDDYTYTPGRIFIKRTTHSFNASSNTMQIFIDSASSITDNNMNILSAVFPYNGSNKDSTVLTYANMPNPIAKLNIFSSLRPYQLFEGDDLIQSPNVWISEYQANFQTGNLVFFNNLKQLNITYNSSGYPVTSTISLNQSSSSLISYWNRYYYYKAL